MKISDRHDHLRGQLIVKSKGNLYQEVESVVKGCALEFGRDRPQQVKKALAAQLNQLGWADRVRLQGRNNLTINFMKNKTGLCVQLGNVARTYADLIKLAYLWEKKIIDCGIILVPDNNASSMLGANYADFDRLSREIELFSGIIKTPVLILALSN
jgi:hypothetical protein